MFGQGLLDAIIYGLVEWHTKRVVRRRVRQGTFSPRGSNGPHSNQGFGQAIRNLGRSGNKRSAADGGTGSGLGSALGLGSKAAAQTDIEVQQTASMRSPTVSFVDPEKSMLQRLDISRPETKNSAASSATVVRASSQDERGPERTSQRRQVT